MQKIITACSEMHDNLWAFLVLLLASVVAIGGAILGAVITFRFHGTDMRVVSDLLVFAGSLVTVAAAMFHSSNRNHRERHTDKPHADASTNTTRVG